MPPKVRVNQSVEDCLSKIGPNKSKAFLRTKFKDKEKQRSLKRMQRLREKLDRVKLINRRRYCNLT